MKAALVRITIITGLLLIFFAALPGGCTVFPRSASQGKIAFISNRVELPGDKPGYFHLYVMNPDGSHQTRLTNGERHDYSLSWSPDGKKIVFGSTENGTSHIYVINADGTGETRLTNGPGIDSEPAWSPDGKRILFTSNRDVDDPHRPLEIYVMNPDGTNQTRLTYNGYCAYPRWSLDGSRIIFTSSGNSTGGIYVIKADGADRICILSNQEQENYDASYSPDGSKILFKSIRPGSPPVSLDEGIWVMNADGSNQNKINGSDGRDVGPQWSPDGKWIVFSSNRGSTKDNPTRQIYKMNLDGSGLTGITDTPALNDQPAWSRYAR